MTDNTEAKRPRAVTVGTFDGLHRGHRAVLDTLRSESLARGLCPTVVTFSNHPLDIIAPERAPKCLTTAAEKLHRLEQENVEVIMQTFTPETMGQTALRWMRHLHDDLDARLIVIGYDNTFGSDGRSMTPEDYTRLGRRAGLEVVVAPVVEGCSSSAARKAVAEGRMTDATRILGYPYTLDGIVVHGDRIGRTIGFPTANLSIAEPDHRLLPPYGVYVSDVRLADGRKLRGVTNIGVRPSVASDRPELRIETHILGSPDTTPGFSEDIYGQPLRISLLTMLRPERKFESLEALRSAISADKEKALRYLPSPTFPISQTSQ